MAKDKKSKPKRSLAMAIAHGYNFGVQLAGFQMAYAYPIALSLSSIAICVGLSASINEHYHGLPWYALAAVIVGAIAIAILLAFVVDYLGIGSLKRFRQSTSWLTKLTSLIFMFAGMGISTVAGDTFWQLVFSDWKATFFAAAVNVVILSTELWPKEHKAAIEEASQRSDIVSHAVHQEAKQLVEDLEREATYEVFQEEAFRNSVKAEFAKDAIRHVVAQMQMSIGQSASPKPPELNAPLNTLDSVDAAPQAETPQLPLNIPLDTPAEEKQSPTTGPLADETPQSQPNETVNTPPTSEAAETGDTGPEETPEPETGPLPGRPNLSLVKSLSTQVNRSPADRRAETQRKITYAYDKLLHDTGSIPSLSEVAKSIGMSRQTVSGYAPFKDTSKLDKALYHLRLRPSISNEELAQVLGLSRPASAGFWRAKAKTILAGELEQVSVEEASNE